MTAFRDAVFILTLLIGAAGADSMINAKDFVEIFGAEPPRSNYAELHLKGQMDCRDGRPRRYDLGQAYLDGYETEQAYELVMEEAR